MVLALAPVLGLSLSASAARQPPSQSPSSGSSRSSEPARRTAAAAELSSGARRELRESIERLYTVSGVHNGVLLKPRTRRPDVAEVEVSGDSILIDGTRTMPEVVRAWLGTSGAPELLQLLALSPADRQALFDLPRDVASSPAPPSPVPPVPPTPSVAPPPPMTSAPQTGVEAPEAPEAPEPPEPAEPSAPPPPAVSSGSRIRVGGPVTVGKNEVAEDVWAIGGSVHVEGEVNRDVSAVGGSVRINGRVGGNVKAFGGSIHLGPHSVVMGNVEAVGGTVVREPGSEIHGTLSDIRKMRPFERGEPIDVGPVGVPLAHSLRLFWSLALLVLLMLAVTLAVLLAPRALEQVRARVASEPWTVLIAGVLGALLTLPSLVVLTVVLTITIIGCVLVLLEPFLFVALVLAALVGFAGVAYQVGRVLEGRFSRRFGGPYLTTMVGVVAIASFTLFGDLLAVGGSALRVFAWMFHAFGWAVWILAWVMGFGAAILTAFSNRPQRFRREAAPAAAYPAPPPPPPAPPAGTFEAPPSAADR
ncbi:MAG: polymer-forming cytoskeletal protein [Acidobacteria bacterium]|nr:polymer-forming cytoskeletal protein [Acidobacteriota bacterium]